MENLDKWLHVADLVGRAEAVIGARERRDPGAWAMTAFSRFRAGELLGLSSIASYGGDLAADPAVLLEEAVRSADQLAATGQLADVLRCVLADVRTVLGASDV